MKKVIGFVGLTIVAITSYYVWYVHFNYRFKKITQDKVYKSALINPDDLGEYLEKYNIKTVIDLLNPYIHDKLNPGKMSSIIAEDVAIKKYNEMHHTRVVHVNIPSGQVPTQETLSKFFQILDENTSYPILIHCYHGTGRAQIYSALYRIEYEKWDNADARARTRFMVEGFGYKSSFADGRVKGDFLMHYTPRSSGENATINLIQHQNI